MTLCLNHIYTVLHHQFEKFYIKISGIWESETSIGLVYKFYYNTSTEIYLVLFVESKLIQRQKI